MKLHLRSLKVLDHWMTVTHLIHWTPILRATREKENFHKYRRWVASLGSAYSAEVEHAMLDDGTWKHAQNDCLQETLYASSRNRVDHLVLWVVDTDQWAFKCRASLIFRSKLCVLLAKILCPVFGAVELLIKHCCVFNVFFDAFLVAFKLHDQVMIDRVTTKTANETSRLSSQMHSVDYLKQPNDCMNDRSTILCSQ